MQNIRKTGLTAVLVALVALVTCVAGVAHAQNSAYQATNSSPFRIGWLSRPSFSTDSVYCRSLPIGSTTALSCTTEVVQLPNLAGVPAGGPTPAAPVLRLFITSAKQPADTPVSVNSMSADSFYVTTEISLDGGRSFWPAVSAGAAVATNISSGPTVASYVLPSTAANTTGALAPLMRFLIRAGDAAQINGVRLYGCYPKVN